MTKTFDDSSLLVRKLGRLRAIIVVLILANLGMGGFSVYLLRELDEQYTVLIGDSVPVLADLRELLAQAVAAQRGTGPILLGAPVDRRAALIEQGRGAIERDRQMRRQLLQHPSLPEAKEAHQHL